MVLKDFIIIVNDILIYIGIDRLGLMYDLIKR